MSNGLFDVVKLFPISILLNLLVRQSLISRFEQNDGFLQTSGLLPFEKYYLRQLIKEEIVSRARRGFYRLIDHQNAYMEIEAARMVPTGVFCMYTAWAHYGLMSQAPWEYHMAIPISGKVKSKDLPLIKLCVWNEKAYSLGQTTAEMQGAKLPIYDLEKSVCDAVRCRNSIGYDIMNEIISNYNVKKDKDLKMLSKYANVLGIERIMEHSLSVLFKY